MRAVRERLQGFRDGCILTCCDANSVKPGAKDLTEAASAARTVDGRDKIVGRGSIPPARGAGSPPACPAMPTHGATSISDPPQGRKDPGTHATSLDHPDQRPTECEKGVIDRALRHRWRSPHSRSSAGTSFSPTHQMEARTATRPRDGKIALSRGLCGRDSSPAICESPPSASWAPRRTVVRPVARRPSQEDQKLPCPVYDYRGLLELAARIQRISGNKDAALFPVGMAPTRRAGFNRPMP